MTLIHETIKLRELDKRYTYANLRAGCAFDGCDRAASHWLTRTCDHYCQSDLVCPKHAQLWLEVKYILKNVGN
jgi:hypothetical protein